MLIALASQLADLRNSRGVNCGSIGYRGVSGFPAGLHYFHQILAAVRHNFQLPTLGGASDNPSFNIALHWSYLRKNRNEASVYQAPSALGDALRRAGD